MAQNPGENEAKINAVRDGWKEHAPTAKFYNLTLAQYEEKVKLSLDTRAEIEQLERQLAAARIARDLADVDSMDLTAKVVSSVCGDPNQGNDGALYSSFGYVRKSERASGLTRSAKAKAKAQAPDATEKVA